MMPYEEIEKSGIEIEAFNQHKLAKSCRLPHYHTEKHFTVQYRPEQLQPLLFILNFMTIFYSYISTFGH